MFQFIIVVVISANSANFALDGIKVPAVVYFHCDLRILVIISTPNFFMTNIIVALRVFSFLKNIY